LEEFKYINNRVFLRVMFKQQTKQKSHPVNGWLVIL
jgi:hypothetical protein